MRILVSILGLLVTSACATVAGPHSDNPAFVVVQTTPVAATLSFTDGTSCQTPCRVGVIDTVPVTIARTGYEAQRLVLTRKTKSPMKISLVSVINDVELETMELPDLQ